MGCGLVSIDRYAWHCVRQGCRMFFKCEAKKIPDKTIGNPLAHWQEYRRNKLENIHYK